MGNHPKKALHLTQLNSPDWQTIETSLETSGIGIIPGLLDSDTCAALRALYSQDNLFRNRIIMARHGYGRGEYQYFTYPLPDIVADLRESIYSQLVPVANKWQEQLGMETRFPHSFPVFIQRCHDAGQCRPTPLLLKYEAEDYNCLHQDLYGAHVFPLQVAVLLSKPGKDFSGGEFVVTEQRPRMQSRVEVIDLNQGDAVIFAVNMRPKLGSRGFYRVNMRHGVSQVRKGQRLTLGIIFHDAK